MDRAFRLIVAAITVPVLAACGTDAPARRAVSASPTPPGATVPSAMPSATETVPPAPPPTPTPTGPASTGPADTGPATLPLGGRTIFPTYRVVAYYGTAGTGTLGVLGEASPDRIMPRLRATAAGFATRDRKIQVAYELISSVAQASPGPDGDYSKMIDDAQIQRYVDAARRNKVLVILDVQPGRSDFLSQVRRLDRWLREPHVGLALDPEWRMPPGKVPGRTVGHVKADEVNAVSAHVSDIVRRHNLPEKLFVLHQFRGSMLPDVHRIQRRAGLAMVQHVDGFGTRSQKDATYRSLRRPQQFHLGYKLFYDEDVKLYSPRDVLAFRPTPEYISYQ